MGISPIDDVAGTGAGPTLEVAVSRFGDAGFVLGLAGDLDLATAPDVERVIDGLAETGRPVHLDLTHVAFLDVAGLHMLLSTCVTPRAGAEVHVIASSDAVRRLLDIALDVDSSD